MLHELLADAPGERPTRSKGRAPYTGTVCTTACRVFELRRWGPLRSTVGSTVAQGTSRRRFAAVGPSNSTVRSTVQIPDRSGRRRQRCLAVIQHPKPSDAEPPRRRSVPAQLLDVPDAGLSERRDCVDDDLRVLRCKPSEVATSRALEPERAHVGLPRRTKSLITEDSARSSPRQGAEISSTSTTWSSGRDPRTPLRCGSPGANDVFAGLVVELGGKGGISSSRVGAQLVECCSGAVVDGAASRSSASSSSGSTSSASSVATRPASLARCSDDLVGQQDGMLGAWLLRANRARTSSAFGDLEQRGSTRCLFADEVDHPNLTALFGARWLRSGLDLLLESLDFGFKFGGLAF